MLARLLSRRSVAYSAASQVRCHASYGVAPLTHREVFDKYSALDVDLPDPLSLLEKVEARMEGWKLNKWELRMPVMVSQLQREQIQLQQNVLKTLVLDQARLRKEVEKDLQIVGGTLGLSPSEVRTKNRAWLQEEVAQLRWKGEVNKAKAVRDAYVRLEQYGSRDYRLLERLCCVYGLAKQGTFTDAFSNYIVEDPITKKASIDSDEIFQKLVAYIVRTYPSIDILYDFLGLNQLSGYRQALGKYISVVLAGRNGAGALTAHGRILYESSMPTRTVLFDFANSAATIGTADITQGVPDFVVVTGSDIILVTIASPNLWHRNRQLSHRKQLEGIARRMSLVLRTPYDEMRIRNLLLPPTYMDKASLSRLNEVVLGITDDEARDIAPWVCLYNKELDPTDVDFMELAKVSNEEEWLRL